jgi:hypothetical protein
VTAQGIQRERWLVADAGLLSGLVATRHQGCRRLGGIPSQLRRTILGATMHTGYKLADLLVILENCKQIEVPMHFKVGAFGPKICDTRQRRRRCSE